MPSHHDRTQGQPNAPALSPRLAKGERAAIRSQCLAELAVLNKLQDGRNRGNIAFQNRKFAEAVAAYTHTMHLERVYLNTPLRRPTYKMLLQMS